MTTNETTTDPAAELAALYPLMTKAGCWPEEMKLYSDKCPEAGFAYTDHIRSSGKEDFEVKVVLLDHHALAIVRDAAEDWLRGRPDEIVYCPREDAYISLFHGNDVVADSLTAAIEAELGRGEG